MGPSLPPRGTNGSGRRLGVSVRGRIIVLIGLLLTANVVGWALTASAYRGLPVVMGTALLAYTFGLRHAVDADHIAAIDNVTRKLMQAGQRPTSVGLFFSLGHSTVVFLASAAVAVTTSAVQDRFSALRAVGGVLGTGISAAFLLAIATANFYILVGVWQTFRRVRDGGTYRDDDLNPLLANRGLLNRLFRPLFSAIRCSWHMYPLGVLFGLGFDTATEIGVLGISAESATQGLPIWSIMIFPALFALGMTLIDTADSILMLGAYHWAFVKPVRKLYYNLTVTGVSVVIAALIGLVEILGIVGDQLGLSDGVWGVVARLNANFTSVGFLIIGVFVASWIVSFGIYRWKGYDRIDVERA